MSVMQIEDVSEFAPEVLDADGKVLVDFWASWCGPCMMMGPIVEQIELNHPELKVVKVNVDEVQQPAIEYGIDSIPAFLLFENGTLIKKALGAVPLEVLEQRLGL